MHIMVEGEVASVTYHSSGHIYFSIKDDSSSVRCVMWRSTAAKLKFKLQKGEHIVIEGSVGVYIPRGEYQFIAAKVEPYGKGALALAYEQLKEKLKKKGYFDHSRKKSIPKYPKKIALVTAANSAALQDMIKVATKRWSMINIAVIDVLVQGESASMQIAGGISYANSLDVDVIIIGRGGGSSEDLWAFNEEVVADAVFASTAPIVSAVGHEVDTVISDFVADLRAPTPSAAMEMILPDRNEILLMLDDRMEQYIRRLRHVISSKESRLDSLRAEFARSSLQNRLAIMKDRFSRLEQEFVSVMTYRLDQYEQTTKPMIEKFTEGLEFIIRNKERELDSHHTRLLSLDPSKQVRESWVQINRNGKKVSLEDIGIGDEFDLLSDKIKMRVKSIKKEIL